MKPKAKCLLLLILSFCLGLLPALSSCSGKQTGTYYPDSAEMQESLQRRGYEVTVSELSGEDGAGTCLSAEKGADFIRAYWLENAESVRYYAGVEEQIGGYDRLVSLENDETYGCLVMCATSAAMEDAGVRIVSVTVKV